MGIFCNRFCRMSLATALLAGLFASYIRAQEVHPPMDVPSDQLYAAPKDFHEDWNNLSLTTSHLAPIEPILGSTYEPKDGDFVRKMYQVGWRPGDSFDLYVILPKGVKNPPVAVYLYDFPQDATRFKTDRWCQLATEGGVAAVGFVSALTGDRFHDRPMKEWFISEMQESLDTSAHDVQMVISYLESRGDLDTTRLGLYGSGSGGTIGILAAAVDPRIKVLDVIGPWGDWPEWMATTSKVHPEEHALFTKPDYLAKIAPFDPVNWVSKVKTQKMRIQNTRSNGEISDKAQLAIEAAAPSTAVIYQYGDAMALLRSTLASGGFLGWMQKQLQAASEDKIVADRDKNTHFFPALGGKLPDPNTPVQRAN
jgi:hypothetical protein